jgi:flavin-dependent dehydrogenase
LRQKVGTGTAGRVLLVGDAAGYIDALTGEGMGLAFEPVVLAVNWWSANGPTTTTASGAG